jgi:hypothetical protein
LNSPPVTSVGSLGILKKTSIDTNRAIADWPL